MDSPSCYPGYQQARNVVFEFIEIWYNRQRLHSTLNYQSQVQAEQNLIKQLAA